MTNIKDVEWQSEMLCVTWLCTLQSKPYFLGEFVWLMQVRVRWHFLTEKAYSITKWVQKLFWRGHGIKTKCGAYCNAYRSRGPDVKYLCQWDKQVRRRKSKLMSNKHLPPNLSNWHCPSLSHCGHTHRTLWRKHPMVNMGVFHKSLSISLWETCPLYLSLDYSAFTQAQLWQPSETSWIW